VQPLATELIVPTDEILGILKASDLPVDTQPVPFAEDLLDRRVAIATVYEEDGDLRSAAPAHVGLVVMRGAETGHLHLNWRERPRPDNTTLIVPERFHAPIAPDQDYPNLTKLFAVQSLVYVLPRRDLIY
jgi:hypothetical protein